MVDERALRHLRVQVDGVEVFYREAGARDAPVLLLPHGYPASSYAYRRLLPRLSDHYRVIAPDFPGCGYSATPDDFDYTFDGYAAFLARFVAALGVERYALYLHDFGSQIGLRLAIAAPERVTALIIQNGDIYEDTLGPKYAALRAHWEHPSDETRRVIAAAISKEGYQDEFLNGVHDEDVARVPPDLWELHWALTTDARRRLALSLIEGLADNRAWFPRYQAYLREQSPPTLIVWGVRDGYMPEPAARAYLRDLPGAELNLFDGGHWLLETHFEEVVHLVRDFLARTLR